MENPSSLFSLQGRSILVTGASSGIGRQIALRAFGMGADLYITGRDEARLEETRSLLTAKVTCIAADLTREEDIRKLVQTLPKIQGVVCCAGLVDYTPVKFISNTKIQDLFSINFSSQVLLTKELVREKKLEKGASLVYISSISSQLGVPATAVYAASKAALNAFVRVTASELAGQRIRANALCPGLVKTPLLSKAAEGNLSEEAFAEAGKAYPLGLGEVDDVAGPAVFLLSDAARWITGTTIIADGGLTLQ